MEWMKLLAILGAALIIWILWRGIKGRPEAFSKANLNKSFSTMGLLALVLIAFVTLCILALRSTG